MAKSCHQRCIGFGRDHFQRRESSPPRQPESHQQQRLAENLQKYGGFIPGYRPGKHTADYLERVLNRITIAGALFLGIIAMAPLFGRSFTSSTSLAFSSTALLIVVGVVLDTMRQLEAQLLMRKYESFIR